MITIFNRKEVCTTYSMQVQSNVLTALRAAGIACYVKTVSRGSRDFIGRGNVTAHTGSAGENPALTIQYIIYVHKNDYERCRPIVGKATQPVK